MAGRGRALMDGLAIVLVELAAVFLLFVKVVEAAEDIE